MIKKLLVSICFCLFCMLGFSQTLVKKSSIYIQFGPSFPIGDFGKDDRNNYESGYAETGFLGDVNYTFKLTKNFGFLADVRGRMYRQSLNDDSDNSLKYKYGKWKFLGATAGFLQCVVLSKNDKLNLEFRETAGLQFNQSPEINVVVGGVFGSPQTYKTPSYSATSFSYVLGLGFNYRVTDKLKLRLFADYNGANVNFDQPFKVTNDPEYMRKQSLRQKVNSVDAGLGLGIDL